MKQQRIFLRKKLISIGKTFLFLSLGVFLVMILFLSFLSIPILKTWNNPEAKECVAMIHGLGRSPKSFFFTKLYLMRAGYRVVSPWYPSTKKDIESLASEVEKQINVECSDMEKIHIVTHSLWGIITRYMFEEKDIEKIGNIVMLAPPNKWSDIVDTFKNYAWFEWINGPTGITLGTAPTDLPQKLPSTIQDPVSVGIIAGSISFNPLYSYLIPGEDDGKVSIESSKLDDAIAHIVIPSSHTFIMNHPLALVQIHHFLQFWAFDKNLTIKKAFHEVFRVFSSSY